MLKQPAVNQTVWRDKNLKKFNICVRCRYDSGECALRRLTGIGGMFIYVESIVGNVPQASGDSGTIRMLDSVSRSPPVSSDNNPHKFTLPIKPITADELSAILTSEA